MIQMSTAAVRTASVSAILHMRIRVVLDAQSTAQYQALREPARLVSHVRCYRRQNKHALQPFYVIYCELTVNALNAIQMHIG